jgi:hypothetical protein
MPYKNVLAGQEATADDANDLFMQQVVARFTNAAARTTAITTPELNQLTMLDSRAGYVQYWNGTAWVDLAYVPPVIPAVPPSPLPDGYHLQYGSSVMTTDGGGNCGLAYPIAFAGTGSVPVATEGGGLGANVGLNNANNAIVGFNLQGPGGGAVANGLVRVNWMAVGIRA